MPQNWAILVPRDKTWFVGARTIYGEPKHWPASRDHGEIIIPLCQIEGLSVEEIGQSVLESVPVARACYADHVADTYRLSGDQDYYSRADGEQLQAMIFSDLPLLERYQYDENLEAGSLDVAIAFLQKVKARHDARPPQRQSARNIIARDYKAIFERIGGRDGFHCGACATTSNLQIDHIIAVSYGGTSEDSNLQLLCGPCNSRKGTQTIDYRKVSPDAEISTEPDLYTEQPPISEDMSGISN